MTSLPPDIEKAALVGWALYPASRTTRAGCIKNATQLATPDLDQLERWPKDFPLCNWRVVFGPSRIWGLDLDTPATHKHDGVQAMTDLIKAYGPLPNRPTMRSGGGGLAVFFRHDGERIVGDSGHPAPGIDPRRGAQSQTIPPSIHLTTGRPYRWLAAPWDIAPPSAPAWLLRLVEPPLRPPPAAPRPIATTGDEGRRYALGALRHAVERVATAGEGRRNDSLNRECYSIGRFVRDGALRAQEVADALALAARA